MLRGADVFLPDDLGFAVDASAFAEVVIGFPADKFFGEAGHLLGHTLFLNGCQEENNVVNLWLLIRQIS